MQKTRCMTVRSLTGVTFIYIVNNYVVGHQGPDACNKGMSQTAPQQQDGHATSPISEITSNP